MQIDNNKLKKLSTMSDDDFKKFLSAVATQNGLSIPEISKTELSRIRSALNDVSSGDPSMVNAIDSAAANIKKRGDKSHN